MSDDTNDNVAEISQVDINKEMREAYLQYSMSVIVGRALPDVRDGLKPVHRRILFAQHNLNNSHNRPYLKSARIVGDVIGKYHPHGDSAVYDSMVRMAQDFSLRYPLVDGQGNFGSIDGDNAAAQRYTEARMTSLAEELLTDIEKETVDFGPNYDDSLELPLVLPAKFPNLLVNGSSGIAVGMATNIPPHNLSEVIEGCVQVIDDPNISIDELIKTIPGPDFPSAGIIAGRSGIVQAYKKGRGIITLKSVAEIVENKGREDIIVTEIPFQVNKAKLIESMADLVKDKKVEGISDIRDESSREGMRIVISVKKNDNANVILNQLYKYTQLQVRYGIILLALDARNQPKTFNLKEILQAFIDHRFNVVTKRCLFDLKKAEARAHILEGLKRALDDIDAVIETIRGSKEAKIAKVALQDKFGFTEIQAQAILEMRLQRLTGLEREKLENELNELLKQIEWLKSVLGDQSKIYEIIKEELSEIKKSYGDARKTQVTGEDSEIEDEDLIDDESVIVTYTNKGLIKRIPTDSYKAQKRGGKGLKGSVKQDGEDFITNVFSASTLTTLMAFSNKGKVYWTRVYKIPSGSRTSKGKNIVNLVNLSNGEKALALLPVNEFEEGKFVTLVTRKGVIKKSPLESFSKPRAGGIIAITIDLDDELIDAQITDGKSDVFITTKKGMSIRFSESNVRSMGRTAKGVRGIALSEGDQVVGMQVIQSQSDETVVIVTEHGYGKRVKMSEYRTQSRGGVGIITQKLTDKGGHLVGVNLAPDGKDLMIITDKGQTIRMTCDEISTLSRNTQGVRLINLKGEERVSGTTVVDRDEDELE